ncbi:myb-like protein D isoform X2 [Planococcus citri]|uniref:myb-like protein D isoform X2 n=1 Tax=Planococcus citri TaxID=170843 RepID=UPI0031F86EE6
MEAPSSPSQEEIETFIQQTQSPAGNRYWVREKREIVYKIFRAEILDHTLSLTTTKVREAIAQLEEVPDIFMEARIKSFVYRARKDVNKSHDNETESPAPSKSSKPKTNSSKKPKATRKFYWVPEKRRIVYKIFKKEILDVDLQIVAEKVRRVLDEFGEADNLKNSNRVRSFVTRIRKERLRKIENGKSVTPLPSDTESGAEGTTDSPEGAELPSESGNDSGTVDQDASVNDQKEIKVVSDLESLIDSSMNAAHVGEDEADRVPDETKLDSGVHSLKEENLEHEDYKSSSENVDEKAKSDFILESFIENRSKSGNVKSELESGQGERKCYPPANSLKRKSLKFESNDDDTMENTYEASISADVEQSFNKSCSDQSNVEESKSENDQGETKLDFVESSMNESTSMDIENDDSSKNAEEDSKCNSGSVAELLIENQLSSENVNKGASEDDQEETKLELDKQSADETAAENLENDKQAPKIHEEEMKFDPGTQSSNNNDMVSENNHDTVVVDQNEAKLPSAVRSPSENESHSMISETVPENCSEETKCSTVVPSSNETENTNGDISKTGAEETKSESAVQSLNVIMDSENTNGDTSKNEAEETKLDSGIQSNGTDCENIDNGALENDEKTGTESLNGNCMDFENTIEDSLEKDGEKTRFDSVEQSLDESHMDCENNEKVSVNRKRKSSPKNDEEVPVIPKKIKTQWTPEMMSVMKKHFAKQLAESNWPVESDKVDFMVNFLKSNGFDGITSEKVFAWANNQLNDNSEVFNDKVVECLVGGVMNGNVDLESILKSNIEHNELPQSSSNEFNAEKLNGTNDLPSEQSRSLVSVEGDIFDDLGVIKLPPKKPQVADEVKLNEENEDL